MRTPSCSNWNQISRVLCKATGLGCNWQPRHVVLRGYWQLMQIQLSRKNMNKLFFQKIVMRCFATVIANSCIYGSGWWFGTFFYDFPFSWECRNPNLLTHIFQRGRSTTNQWMCWFSCLFFVVFCKSQRVAKAKEWQMLFSRLRWLVRQCSLKGSAVDHTGCWWICKAAVDHWGVGKTMPSTTHDWKW